MQTGNLVIWENKEYLILHKSCVQRHHQLFRQHQYLLTSNNTLFIGFFNYSMITWVHPVSLDSKNPEANFKNRDTKSQEIVKHYAIVKKRTDKINKILNE